MKYATAGTTDFCRNFRIESAPTITKTTSVAPPKLQYVREGLTIAHGVEGWRRLAPYKQIEALSTRFLPLLEKGKDHFSNRNNPVQYQDDARCSAKAPIRSGGTHTSARSLDISEVLVIRQVWSNFSFRFGSVSFVPASDVFRWLSMSLQS